MITAYALAAGLNALLAQPLFDDVEAQRLALYESSALASDQGVASIQQDARLDRKISKRFDNVPVREVLQWLAGEGVSFVVRDTELTESRISINFVDEPMRNAVNAIADACGGSWRKHGSVYVFHKGESAFFSVPAVAEGMPLRNFSVDMPAIARAREMSDADRRELEMHLKEIEPELAKLKDLKIEVPKMDFSKMHGGKMTDEQKRELEKSLAHLKDLKIEIPKMDFSKMHDGQMTDEHRMALEKSLSHLKDLKVEGLALREHHMTDQQKKEFKTRMEKFSQEMARAHADGAVKFSKQHAEEMKKLGQEMAKVFVDGQGKTFMLKQGKPGDKGVHLFTRPDGKGVRVFTGPDDKSRLFAEGRAGRLLSVPAPGFAMTEGNIKKLMESLTATQRQTMRSKGFIKFSDLTSSQKAMLGDLSGSKNFSITYVIDGQKLSIKSGD